MLSGSWTVGATGSASLIEQAKEEIFIVSGFCRAEHGKISVDILFQAAWWLSPEVYLRRPAPTNPANKDHWRLDQTLLRAAERVHVYVLHYQALRFSFGVNSAYSKQHLEALHPNIRVLCHPEHELMDADASGAWFWTNHEKLVVVDQVVAFVGGIDLCFGRWDDERHALTDAPYLPLAAAEEPNKSLQPCLGEQFWPGKDYANIYIRDFIDVDKPFEDFIDRRRVVRMPWHDIHSVVYGEAAVDVARHFLQRWNEAKAEVGKWRDDPHYPYLLPISSHLTRQDGVEGVDRGPPGYRVEVQVLRSAAQWSTGVRRVEQSVLRAHIHLIENSQHYVYLENEFFISNPLPTSKEEEDGVRNEVAHALLERIVSAKERGETFRLYVMLPLLPAFEGRDRLEEDSYSSPLLALLHYTYATISRGPNSLLGQLQAWGVHDWRNYVSFCSARTHTGAVGSGNGCSDWPPVSEIVYIHSKLMIVDDVWTLIGSANLNDRSMLGERDSEVCLLIKDTQFLSDPPKSMGVRDAMHTR